MADVLELLRTALEERYAVERLIGEGGMATVYLANDIRHDRKVAIKVLRPELAASIGADRFLREIKVAAKLQHPNILPLYDSGEASDFLYYVMPFVEGESLRAPMEREEQLSLPDSIQLTCDIADALHYAHTNKVVHRDIKPENILLRDGRPLVADFGIARAVSAAGEKLTETGMAVGTPHYMSPEQGLASEHIDGRTDQYSLACMLYEMLVGQPPFHGPNAMAILARHSWRRCPACRWCAIRFPMRWKTRSCGRWRRPRPIDFPPSGISPMRSPKWISGVLHAVPPPARCEHGALLPQGVRRTTGSVRAEPKRASSQGPGVCPISGQGVLVNRDRRDSGRPGALGLVGVAATRHGLGRGFRFQSQSDRGDVLRSRGGQDSIGYLADGLTEALIHELSEVNRFRSISRGGVAPYRNAAVAPDSIGRALKVGTLVQGSVAGFGNKLRVSVSLTNAATGEEIGSKTLERPREEIFALQDDVAREVSLFLRQRLGEEINLQEIRTGTRNPKAWELVQQAGKLSKDVEPLLTAGDTAAAARRLDAADSILAGVERLDPRWVTPPIERGWLAYRQTDLADGFDKPLYSKWTTRGLEDANRALKIKPDDPDALELRGILEYLRWILNLEPDQARAKQLLDAAEQDLRAAVAAKPTAARAWTYLSHLLSGQGQLAESKLAAVRSYEADPYLSSAKQTLYSLFMASYSLEDQVEATHWCDEGSQRFPDYYRFAECRLWLMSMKGQTPDIAKAWQVLAEFVKLTPANLRAYYSLYGRMLVGMALVQAGLPDSARSVVSRSRGDATVDAGRDLAYYEALVRTQLGDRDEAFRLLSTYVAANPQQRANIAKDEGLKDLRSDPRFVTLFGKPGPS